tara:strand:+ start:970 stop:1293 length:324 start_codon:yes stop_codon:yes gene_type:complete
MESFLLTSVVVALIFLGVAVASLVHLYITDKIGREFQQHEKINSIQYQYVNDTISALTYEVASLRIKIEQMAVDSSDLETTQEIYVRNNTQELCSPQGTAREDSVWD